MMSKAVYKLGTGLEVSLKLHEENRARLCERLKTPKSLVLLEGGKTTLRGGSDSESIFRQESFFHWAFGVLEPNFYGVIDVDNKKSILFMPRLDETYAIFMGALESPDDVKMKYGVHEVHYVDEIFTVLRNLNPLEIHLLYGLNTDSGTFNEVVNLDGLSEFRLNMSVLYNEIVECRVIKTARELEVLRYANLMSSKAHKDVMRNVKPGMFEYQAESIFLHNCYFHGAMRNVAYTSIGATGCNCSILHYGHAGAPNSRKINDGDMCLFDMGGEYYCYSSDITCSFPVNGHFTKDQKMVYEAVLAASRAVMRESRPGVSWVDMHKLAEKEILNHLKNNGLLQGEVEEMMMVRLGGIFMPHGLGHLMGCDVHDVGGYLGDAQTRSTERGLKSLRVTRTLIENMVLTIEPGCYFVDFLLDEALNNPTQAKFLVEKEVQRFRGFGGVRIEDNVIVTASGIEVMTNVPRTCQEIEEWMTGN